MRQFVWEPFVAFDGAGRAQTSIRKTLFPILTPPLLIRKTLGPELTHCESASPPAEGDKLSTL